MKAAAVLLALLLPACKDDGRECVRYDSVMIFIPITIGNTMIMQPHWIHSCAEWKEKAKPEATS